MALKNTVISHDRIIASVHPKAIGLRPKKITLLPSGTICDIYFNGLNLLSSGSLYLTSTASGMFEHEVPIIIDDIDTGLIGELFDFELESEYSVKISDVKVKTKGQIDSLIVIGDSINQLSSNYEYGFHMIDVVV